MVLAIGQRHLDVNHLVPGPGAVLESFLDSLLDGRDELCRDRAALDLVDEVKAPTGVRLDVDVHDAVLTRTAGLAHEATLDLLRRAADRLAVGDLRTAN